MDKDVLLAQYKECWAHIREHKRFIWEIPTITATVGGAFVAVAFIYVPSSQWLVRELLLAFGLILTFCLLIATIKHRYFTHIWQESIIKIENELGVKKVQTFTKGPNRDYKDYWYTKDAKGLEHFSAHDTLVRGMYAIMFLYVVLLVAVPLICT